jgi:hypothetical protein
MIWLPGRTAKNGLTALLPDIDGRSAIARRFILLRCASRSLPTGAPANFGLVHVLKAEPLVTESPAIGERTVHHLEAGSNRLKPAQPQHPTPQQDAADPVLNQCSDAIRLEPKVMPRTNRPGCNMNFSSKRMNCFLAKSTSGRPARSTKSNCGLFVALSRRCLTASPYQST